MSSNDKFDWQDFYKVADSFSNSNDSAELRSGISRFYYAAFGSCKEYIIEHRLWGNDEELKEIMTEKSVKVHETTAEIFRNNVYINRYVDGHKISRILHDLRKKRNDADYNSDKYNVKFNFNFVKARANIVFQELKKL